MDNAFFTVTHDDDASFVDKTFEARSYSGDSFGLELVSAEDYLYVGLYKPFNSIYVEMATANTNANTLALEYFDKDALAFTSLDLLDESKGFTRSGFLTFQKPVDAQNQNAWATTTVNGDELYWIRLKPSADHSVGTIVQGLNIVFSNDDDLVEERSNIVSKHASNQPTGSWILKHQAAKKEIIQKIRDKGNMKFRSNDNRPHLRFADINEFDLLDFTQLRQASKFLVLSKIFLFELSDEEDDKYFMVGKDYEDKFKSAMEVFFLSLDKDDDGIQDASEYQEFINVPVRRR